ncbi:O-antigen ligase family protein [Bradyrhizobium sp. TZ2]
MPSILALAYGLAGSGGNSIATGAAQAASLAILAALAWRRPSRLDHVDLALGVLAAIAAVSSVTAIAASRNETIALALTLTSYLAARGLSLEDLPSIRHGTLIAAGTITVIGTPLTAHALSEQWSDPHGHPIVLGLPSAVTMLTMAIGFLVIAVATDGPGGRRLAAWCAALFLPIAIAAASMVRFALMATLGAALVASAIASCRRQRLAAAALALTVLVAAACGLGARHQTSAAFMRQFTAAAGALAPIAIPSAVAAPVAAPGNARMACDVEIDNSIAIRKALLSQTLSLIPQAGPFGLGLDSFLRQSCLGMMPHNTLLQALVEFGWIGGGMLMILMVSVALRLVPIARNNRAAAFLLCALAYMSALSMTHGSLSRDVGLFLLLGAGAGVIAGCRRPISSSLRKIPHHGFAQPIDVKDQRDFARGRDPAATVDAGKRLSP